MKRSGAWGLAVHCAVAAGCSPEAPLEPGPPPSSCPSYAAGENRGRVAGEGMTELSGLVASRRQVGVLWAHNDSGDAARVFALRASDGAHLGTYDVSGAVASDWEDIALGETEDGDALFIGDIGDNPGARADVRIYVVPEPSVALEQPLSVGTIDGAFTMTLTYPDRAQDAETLLIDPDSGALFIITKSVVGQSGVYRKEAPHRADDVAELEWVAAIDLTEPPFAGSLFITAGDVSPSGEEVVLRTYDAAYLVPRGEGTSLAEALAHNAPCPLLVASEVQGEAIAFAAEGTGLFTVSENPEQDPDAPQPLWFYRAE